MPDYARFCGYCGADMTEEQNTPEQQASEPVHAKDTAAQMSPSQASPEPLQPPIETTVSSPQSVPESQEIPNTTIDETELPPIQAVNDTAVPPISHDVPESQVIPTSVPDGYSEAPPPIQTKKNTHG